MPAARPCMGASCSALLGLFEVSVEPLRDLLEPPHPVLRQAAAAELVVFSPENTHACLYAVIFEGGVHLDAFGQPAAVVLVAVDEKSRRVHVVGVLQGRVPPQFVRAGPCGFAYLVRVEVVADVGGVGFREPVGDAPLCRGCPETVRVADDPVRHETAVGPARDAHPVGVHPWVLLQTLVDEGHDVAVVHRAVFAPDVGEPGALAVAPRGVAEDDRVSAGRPVLHLVEEH